MRIMLALTALVALTAAAPIDYSHVVVATPEHGFRMGNPAARVKLVEYASLTCPHCRAFHTEAMTSLTRDYVAKGLVSYEYRNLILNGADIAVSVLARCDGPATFFRRADAFYKDQPTWFEPFTTIPDADLEKLKALPEPRQLAAYATLGKMDKFVAAHGITKVHFTACLSNKGLSDTLSQMASDAEKLGIHSTPSFVIDGKKTDFHGWDEVEPALRAALKLKPKAA